MMQRDFQALKARHLYRWSRLSVCVLCAVSVLLIGAEGLAADTNCTSTILDDCSGITSLPTAAECEEDDCACAQNIECYLRNQDPITNWPLVPGGELEIEQNFFHERFIETRISPDSYDDWVKFTDPANGPADFPDGTVVYKSGFLPSSDDYSKPLTPPVKTYAFTKLSGYCPDGSTTVEDFCLGGDWFSLQVVNVDYGDLEAGGLETYGKSTACFVCHSPAAAEADWMLKLNSVRRYP